MPAQKKYQGQIEEIGEGRIELLQVQLDLSSAEQKEFLKDPTRFFWKFFKAHRLVTNDVIIGAHTAEALSASVRKMKKSGPVVGTLITIIAHVEEPRKHRSKRIVLTFPHR